MNSQNLVVFMTITAALSDYALFMLSLHRLYSLWLASAWADAIEEGLAPLF